MKKQFRITLNGKSYDVVAEIIGEEPASPSPSSGSGQRRSTRSAGAGTVAAPSEKKAPATSPEGDIPSPLAGKVVSIDVSPGDSVEAGQTIITLEAMKMNTIVSSPASGTVKKIHVSAGDAVEEGQPLLSIE
ncbi:MAG: biotin/lipoyl-containing protein [Oceanipulchritudo sp.]